MKTISLKTFALLATFSLLTSVNYSLAAEGVKSSEALGVAASINTTAVAKDNLEDPDLKLSIEELRKKYPIAWFDKKYGKYYPCESGGASYVEGRKYPRVVCDFTTDKSKVEGGSFQTALLDVFKDFTEAEIKSVIVNYDKKSNDDMRPDKILIILLKQFNQKNEKGTLEKRIKNFFYSDKILDSFGSLPCGAFKELDVGNKHYETLAVNYFKAVYSESSQIRMTSLDEHLKRCVNENKFDVVRKKLLEEFKSKKIY